MRTLSATTQIRKVNKKEEAKEMGHVVIGMAILVVGAIMTSGKLLIWAAVASVMCLIYQRISTPSRLLVVAASAATAASFLAPHVFSAWY
ncbi:hypothetical protein HY621_02190 [Candidatus Uhrbacteria bacterium]|nr:hypothetical protein [Candidatus Uhrbacteria bacterium]